MPRPDDKGTTMLMGSDLPVRHARRASGLHICQLTVSPAGGYVASRLKCALKAYATGKRITNAKITGVTRSLSLKSRLVGKRNVLTYFCDNGCPALHMRCCCTLPFNRPQANTHRKSAPHPVARQFFSIRSPFFYKRVIPDLIQTDKRRQQHSHAHKRQGDKVQTQRIKRPSFARCRNPRNSGNKRTGAKGNTTYRHSERICANAGESRSINIARNGARTRGNTR